MRESIHPDQVTAVELDLHGMADSTPDADSQRTMLARYESIKRKRPIEWVEDPSEVKLPKVYDDDGRRKVQMVWPDTAPWPEEGEGCYVVFELQMHNGNRWRIPLKCFARQEPAVRWALSEQGLEVS